MELPEEKASASCHNNLFVSSEWNGSSSMKLTCHHCNSLGTEDSFRWMLNSKRLGNPRWAKKSNRGSTITIYPIRQVVWGHWECHSLANSSWISEICLSPLTEEKDTGTTRITHEDFPSAQPTSLAASHWSHPPVTKTTDAPSTGHTRKGIPVWIWAVTVLLVVLVIIPAVLGAVVSLWKRKADRKCRESRERTDHPFLRYDPRKKKDLMKRESLHERSTSLHYAQLQHLQKKSSTVQTPDNTTVYAVIV
ncbi:hypothetical protein JD844_013483 [Phrynosoma platyrhinos]|uniref:Uncharacterized protein n=1 Tax=Phrynosoma platyrhinos TaxID=52577 RepID=A0ABQ7TKW2_PHRPL|nr:hypothetical protein JD844_013483 [Phrynosoma platyrhinos]